MNLTKNSSLKKFLQEDKTQKVEIMNQLKSISNMIEEANSSLRKEKWSILILEKRKRKWL